jgi:hypothetical protein
VDNLDTPFTRPECPHEEILEGFLSLRCAHAMKVEVGLYGKITPVQSFRKLRKDAAAYSFYVFGRLRDYKPLAIFNQVFQRLPDILFRFTDELIRKRDRRVFSFMIFIPVQRRKRGTSTLFRTNNNPHDRID